MAKKITQLPLVTSLALTDLMVGVVLGAGVNGTSKITVQNVFNAFALTSLTWTQKQSFTGGLAVNASSWTGTTAVLAGPLAGVTAGNYSELARFGDARGNVGSDGLRVTQYRMSNDGTQDYSTASIKIGRWVDTSILGQLRFNNDTSGAWEGTFFNIISGANSLGLDASSQRVGTVTNQSFGLMANGTVKTTIYTSGGVYVGASPSDPGANNLTVQGNLSTGGGAIFNTSRTNNTVRLFDNSTSSKYLRAEFGSLQIINNAFTQAIVSIDDLGNTDIYGNVATAARITTGLGISTAECIVEVGGLRTGSGTAAIDLHAVSGTDYETRLVRYSGVNGELDLINTGTGGINFKNIGAAGFTWQVSFAAKAILYTSGGYYVGATPVDPGANNVTVQGRLKVGNSTAPACALDVSSDNVPTSGYGAYIKSTFATAGATSGLGNVAQFVETFITNSSAVSETSFGINSRLRVTGGSGQATGGSRYAVAGVTLAEMATSGGANNCQSVGLLGSTEFWGTHSSVLTHNYAIGVLGSSANLNSNNNAVTIAASFYAAKGSNTSSQGNGTGRSIVSRYGIYIEDQTGATNNFGVYTAGTVKSHFSGGMYIGSSYADPGTNNLSVQGTVTAQDGLIASKTDSVALVVRGRSADNLGAISWRDNALTAGTSCFIQRDASGNFVFGLANAAKGTWYASGGLYVGTSPSDPGANNLTVQGTISVSGTFSAQYHTSSVTGALSSFNYIGNSAWSTTANAVIVGCANYNYTVASAATGASLSNQIIRITYVKQVGAVSNSATAFTAGVDTGFIFNESETGGDVIAHTSNISVASTKTVGKYVAYRANALSGAGTVTNLRAFEATTGSGASHFADGLYIGSVFVAPGANNLSVQGITTLGTDKFVTGTAVVGLGLGAYYGRIGGEGGQNLALDYQTVQARNNGAVNTLKLNGLGGDVEFVANKARMYTSGGLYVGTSPSDPGVNNITVQGNITAAQLLAFVSGTLAGFAAQTTSTWNSASTSGIVGCYNGVFNISATATATTVSNQVIRLVYTKDAGALAAATTAFAAGVDTGFVFNETESGGDVICYNATITIATGKTVGKYTGYKVNPVSGAGTATILRAFEAAAGTGASHLADGVYIGATFSAPGANNLIVQGSTTTNTLNVSSSMQVNVARTGNTVRIYDNGSSSKYIRSELGQFQILNNAFSTVLFTVDDSGNTTTTGNATVSGNMVVTGSLTVGSFGLSGVLSAQLSATVTNNINAQGVTINRTSAFTGTPGSNVANSFANIFAIGAGQTVNMANLNVSYSLMSKAAGAVASAIVGVAAIYESNISFLESETTGTLVGFNSDIGVITGKVLNAFVAFKANANSSSGTITTLRSFQALAGSGVAEFQDGIGINATSFSGTKIYGVKNGTAAVAGQVGEVLQTVIGVTLCPDTGIYGSMGSITLTPGCWLVYGYLESWSTAITNTVGGLLMAGISNSPSGALGSSSVFTSHKLASSDKYGLLTNPDIINVAANTTFYLVHVSTYTVGFPTAYGYIRAIRIR